jgi:urease accessory protein
VARGVSTSRIVRRVAVAAAFAMWVSSAQAHLASTGLGPVYDGISHLLLSLDDLLPLLAMALLAGLSGPLAGRRVLFALPLAWLLGGLLGFQLEAPGLPAWTGSLWLLLLGVLVAADLRLAWPIVAGLAAALGLVQGGLNGAGVASAGGEVIALLGIAGAAFVLTAWASASVVALRAPWSRVAVRVAGSWVAATGLLMLGWSLSGRA